MDTAMRVRLLFYCRPAFYLLEVKRMKFALFSLIQNIPNPVTGETLTAQEKFQHVLNQAVLAEKLGFDAYGVGERHGAPFCLLLLPLF